MLTHEKYCILQYNVKLICIFLKKATTKKNKTCTIQDAAYKWVTKKTKIQKWKRVECNCTGCTKADL